MATVHIIFGPLGAGKSTLARQLVADHQAIRFSIDEWMHHLYDADRPEQLGLNWVWPRVRRCETLIWQTCLPILQAGNDVVLDFGFMTFESRQLHRTLALEAGFQVAGHFVDADRQLRRERVLQRNKVKGETFTFEVTGPMFDAMDAGFQRPTDLEMKECVGA
ncbi:MAG: ATP-binding protein [Parvibaculum sp.]|nr:ATP-binding protein [Parvibaculum sp.]|tara:strand:+ start:9571 stop:10059 length:489 start_codon:yes stop_codon:yes gene_type:complete